MKRTESASGLKILIKQQYKKGNKVQAKKYYKMYKAKGGKMSYLHITEYKTVYRKW